MNVVIEVCATITIVCLTGIVVVGSVRLLWCAWKEWKR